MLFELVDAEKQQRECPDTFKLPSFIERANLYKGDLAKLMFDVDGYVTERMWVEITDRAMDPDEEIHYVGKLANAPFMAPVLEGKKPEAEYPLKMGVLVGFRPKNVIDIIAMPAICRGTTA